MLRELVKIDALISDIFEQSIPTYYFCSGSAEELVLIGSISPDTVRNDPKTGSLFSALPSGDKTMLDSVPYIYKDTDLSAQHRLRYVKSGIVNSVRELSVNSMDMLKNYPVFKVEETP